MAKDNILFKREFWVVIEDISYLTIIRWNISLSFIIRSYLKVIFLSRSILKTLEFDFSIYTKTKIAISSLVLFSFNILNNKKELEFFYSSIEYNYILIY